MPDKPLNRYENIIEKIFFNRYEKRAKTVRFLREDIETTASALAIKLPKNLGDIIYSFRYRNPLPETIRKTQPKGQEWIIEGAGRAKYQFKLVRVNRISPNPDLVTIKIPDATPEIILAYALSDEQALLAKVRYNRLIDVFLGVAAYSLQNHLRTTVKGVGQIEIDEVYTAVDRYGRHFIIPVQAKGGNDQLSVVQTKQDIDCCAQKYPNLICRAISTQFIADDLIAIFELTVEEDYVKVVEEKHYHLVPADAITQKDLQAYSIRA